MCHSEPEALYGASTGKLEPIGFGIVRATRDARACGTGRYLFSHLAVHGLYSTLGECTDNA